MTAGTKFILDPVAFDKFVWEYPNEDAIPDELKSGAFIAEVTLDVPAPDSISQDILITGLNGSIFRFGPNFGSTTADEDEFLAQLTAEVLAQGKDITEAETVVLFRKSIDEYSDVTAVFPFEEAIRNEPFMGCYAHVGQHGSCHLDWVTEKTRPATPDEYANLKKELESAPFNYKFIVLDDLTAIGLEENPEVSPAP